MAQHRFQLAIYTFPHFHPLHTSQEVSIHPNIYILNTKLEYIIIASHIIRLIVIYSTYYAHITYMINYYTIYMIIYNSIYIHAYINI
jgi:hypothetical protein